MTGYECSFCHKRFLAIMTIGNKRFCGACYDKYYEVPEGTKFKLEKPDEKEILQKMRKGDNQ